MRIINNILQYLKNTIPSKKYLLFGLLFFVGYTFAADVSKEDSDAIEMIVQVLNFLFTVITFLLTPAIILCGWLLSPDWTMGDFFGLRPYFIQVWVLVSNLVYIIFALMLLWMAVMQIFSSESNYAFKKKLPRFLVGIMIVPFTWLIVSWTLSFANQAVAAVLSIPSGAIAQMQTDEDGGLFHLRTIPTEFSLDFGDDAPAADASTVSCADNGETESGGVKCISPAEFIANNSSGPFFIILIYAYDIFKIQKTEMIDFSKVCTGIDDPENGQANSSKCISDLSKLLRKFGVAFITTTFFAIILIALCWVLLARAFKLWVYVMFSPLFGLAYAVSDEGLGKTFESEGGGGEGVSLGEVGFKPFFSLAMVPVLVSAVLSFGLLFIGVVNNTFTSGALSDTGGGKFCTTGDFMVKYCIEETKTEPKGYSSYIIIGREGSTTTSGDRPAYITFKFGSMISEFVGNSAGKTATGAVQGFADGANDIFAHIILSLIALAVMWMGVKAAVAHDEVTKAAFAPFAKFGDSVGNFVQHIPSYLPTPHPAFAAFNPATYEAGAKIMNKKVEESVTDHRNALDDMLTRKASALDGAVDGFVSGANSFEDAVQRFGNTTEKSPEKAADLIVKGINKIDKTKLSSASQALVGDFQAQIEANSGSREGLKTVLESSRFSPLITELEETEMKGVTRLASHLGASTSSSTGSPSVGLGESDGNGGFKFKGTNGLQVSSSNAVSGMTVAQAEKIKAKANGDTLDDNAVQELFGTKNITPEQRKALVKEAKDKA